MMKRESQSQVARKKRWVRFILPPIVEDNETDEAACEKAEEDEVKHLQAFLQGNISRKRLC